MGCVCSLNLFKPCAFNVTLKHPITKYRLQPTKRAVPADCQDLSDLETEADNDTFKRLGMQLNAYILKFV